MHSDTPFLISTAIPYVNARPHVGFALELVVADAIARHRRQRGREVFFSTGSDENSLKNVRAAAELGVSTQTLVDENAAVFARLREVLDLSTDAFVRTSVDPGHRRAAEKLWRACFARGDIYRRDYRGLYCVGCEQFYAETELLEGRCPEHGTDPELVEESNYFFRLERYAERLREGIESGELRITPEHFRNEVLAFVDRGLVDFSISRSSERAKGWGIPVPDDSEQVMYVWFDALGNYISALGYADDGEHFRRWWSPAGERVHVLGKGITRFHALYWPAILASAGLAWPSALVVHGYLTVDGNKIGKSMGNAIDPAAIAERCGVDALRYFLLRHVRHGRDGDFGEARVWQCREAELANQLGNLLNRTVHMITRWFDGRVPTPQRSDPGHAELAAQVQGEIERAFDEARTDDALNALWSLVERANRFIVERAPWKLAKSRSDPETEAKLASTLYDAAELLRLVAVHLRPFLPGSSAELVRRLGLDPDAEADWETSCRWGGLVPGTRVRLGAPLFDKKASPLAPPARL